MDGNERGVFVKEEFQGRETMGWGILVYREVTSTVPMILLGGRRMERDYMISRKWLVSLLQEGTDLTMG